MVTQEIVGYRGYGRSTRSLGEDGLHDDAEAAWRYLAETRGQPPNRIVLFGRSLGGAVAIELARRHNPAALVVESTFTSLVGVGGYHYPLHPVSLIATQRFDSLWKIASIACLKLFPQLGDPGNPCLFRRGLSIRRCSRCHETVIRKNRDLRFKEPRATRQVTVVRKNRNRRLKEPTATPLIPTRAVRPGRTLRRWMARAGTPYNRIIYFLFWCLRGEVLRSFTLVKAWPHLRQLCRRIGCGVPTEIPAPIGPKIPA